MRNKGITYIIVTWNNEKEIENCLSSIAENCTMNYQVVVVDNCSSDNTVSIVEKQFPDVELIASKENLGFAGGNNLALKYVKYDYICYLNPDTVLIEDIATPSVEFLKEHPETGLVCCRLLNPNHTIQKSCYSFLTPLKAFADILHINEIFSMVLPNKYFPTFYTGTEPIIIDWAYGAEMILSTEDAFKLNGFSTDYYMYAEDMDICKRVYASLHKNVVLLASKALIHLGGASEKQNVNYKKQLLVARNSAKFAKKFYGNHSDKKLLKSMWYAYSIRSILLKLFYFKNDRKEQIIKSSSQVDTFTAVLRECEQNEKEHKFLF